MFCARYFRHCLQQIFVLLHARSLLSPTSTFFTPSSSGSTSNSFPVASSSALVSSNESVSGRTGPPRPPRPPRTLRRAFFTGARTTRVALTPHLFLHIFGVNRCRFRPSAPGAQFSSFAPDSFVSSPFFVFGTCSQTLLLYV